jgi:hypothetical protein
VTPGGDFARPWPASTGFCQALACGAAFASTNIVLATDESTSCAVDESSFDFCKEVVERLTQSRVPFLIGGAFAFAHFTQMHRDTKDLDLFLKKSDMPRAMKVLGAAGYETELTFPHWLGKAFLGDDFVDLIFNSGNGVAPVDDEFFQYAADDVMFDIPVKVCPIEEMIWTKAFIMERERYDGADVAHLFNLCSGEIDWPRLLRRFGTNWRLLLNHVILFGYIYPHERKSTPAWVMRELLSQLIRDTADSSAQERVCDGTLLSREQYLVDVHDWGYADGRLTKGSMSAEEIELWTKAIEH